MPCCHRSHACCQSRSAAHGQTRRARQHHLHMPVTTPGAPNRVASKGGMLHEVVVQVIKEDAKQRGAEWAALSHTHLLNRWGPSCASNFHRQRASSIQGFDGGEHAGADSAAPMDVTQRRQWMSSGPRGDHVARYHRPSAGPQSMRTMGACPCQPCQ